jgi:hypothetical protein
MRYGGGDHAPVKRLLSILSLVVLALAVVEPAAADSRTVRDARNDFKGSHWPGPGYEWAQAGPVRRFVGARRER